MKAVRFSRFGGPEVLQIVDLADPHPGPGQVRDAAVGGRVFGFSAEGAAQAELAVLSCYAPIPPSLDFAGAAALPAAIETAARALDQLGAGSGTALDVAGSGALPELIELAGGPEHVVTIADFAGAREHGVRFSSGHAGRVLYVLAQIGELVESGRFSLPVARTFPLAQVCAAHRAGEEGHPRGKLVLVVG
jgi:NADPH:quinone reductase-like Zn-dependent oxidoreductase